ncbi:MAG TPA: rhodanese-like domain-containing protein [Polyangiaceae bacterium]|nr:rhodanese-like domain-containing protein [Polyangiaceae bacterium]
MIHESATPHAMGYRDTTPAAVVASAGKVRVVDVREPHEFVGELGHLAGAELVPLATVEAAAAGWDKDAELVLVCRSGARSGRAAALLTQLGFTKAMNMVGGMLAVTEAKLPVVR